MGLRRNKKLKTRLAGSELVRVAVQAPGACGDFSQTSWWEPGEGVGVG